jgi:hypothetical protein
MATATTNHSQPSPGPGGAEGGQADPARGLPAVATTHQPAIPILDERDEVWKPLAYCHGTRKLFTET